MKIEKLTPEQIAKLPEWRDQWLNIGFSTAPIDKGRAKAAVRQMYECAGLTPPEIFIFLDNPEQGAIASAMLKDTKFGAQVGAQVRAQVWDQVGAQVRDQVYRAVFGSHDASWISFYSFFHSEFGLAEKIEGLASVARECGWVWPFEGCVIVTDRPTQIHLSPEKRLHCETGPAIEYRGGLEIYAWNGTRVPREWIMERDTLDPAEIIRHENVEMRAVGASIIGWSKMAEKLDRVVVDGDPETDLGALVELTMPGLPEPGRFLMAQCPRNGTICEGVPRVSDIDGEAINTVIAAQAWRDCLPASEYVHPTLRT